VDNKSVHSKAKEISGGPDDFVSNLSTIRTAENTASRVIESAKKQSAKLVAQAKEKAVEVSTKAAEAAVQAKNEVLEKGRQYTGNEVKKTIREAKKQAQKVSSKRLTEKDVLKLSEGIL